jgi:hypothetical protein
MKSKGSDILLNSEGKGLIGCIGAIILLAALIFVGIKLGPIYYSNFIFEEDIKNVTSRAGARGLKNDVIIEDILELARKNNINLTEKDASKNIKIERYAGMVHIEVLYFVPVDFLVMEKTFKFEITASSFSAF